MDACVAEVEREIGAEDARGLRDEDPRRFVEVPGTSPAGGVTVDLQGAFQSEVTATVDADGHVATRCADAPAAR